jgi:hypothetical protein
MAWIVPVPPSPRHPRPRWKVVYRDDTGSQRSAGIYPTEPAAKAARRRLDRGQCSETATDTPDEATNQQKSLALFGDYITNTWWPRWRDSHPHSAYLWTSPRDAEHICRRHPSPRHGSVA